MSPSLMKEVKGTDFPACFLLGLFHRLSDFPLKTQIQIFSVQKTQSAVHIHLLKEPLYLHRFIFRNINTRTLATEAAPLDTVSDLCNN